MPYGIGYNVGTPRQQGVGRPPPQVSPMAGAPRGINPQMQQQLIQILMQLLQVLQIPSKAVESGIRGGIGGLMPQARGQRTQVTPSQPTTIAPQPPRGSPLPGIRGGAQGGVGAQGVGRGNASQGLPLLMDLIARMGQGGAR
tara:strand:+ start:21297 stop:21722 length:426 start_codon:yes stop_codon:yes gene_type:complete